ncbi:DUF3106 domain-containing protein [Luteimonas sp. MJ204]|uniref:DUF3106 domain-containing protein n=1 Tax=Luteimonas sp. MJ145 TaxID=3129234 RepID=UPI0031BA5EA6
MTPPRPPDPANLAAPTALRAFLRGVERRGHAFAWLLAGSRAAGDDALAWALERFAREAGRTPFGEWPRRFWSLLLAAPAMRRPPPDPHWEPDFEWLSRIGHGPRAALLLRLVAGLAESDAATVLGIARPTYRLGLQRALPRDADGNADVDAWQALGGAVQDLLRAQPHVQPAPSTRSPAAARAAPGPGDGAPTRAPAGRGVRTSLWLVAAATVLGLVATFVRFDGLPAGLAQAPDGILVEALPAAEAPAGRYPEQEALALHPDLALLLDAGEADAAAADPAFHAWLLAEGEADADPVAGADPGAGATATDPPSVTAAAAIRIPAEQPGRPAEERLDALDPTALAQLAQRRELWDAMAHEERGERRERWLAWRDLSVAERQSLRGAAAQHALRTPDEQAALRARFDALDASVRHGWLLGPDLGADYPQLHPLIAQVPLDARTALVEALRGLDPQARDDLVVLAVRTPPQERAELRIELLATPPAQRSRWLRRRVAPVQ